MPSPTEVKRPTPRRRSSPSLLLAFSSFATRAHNVLSFATRPNHVEAILSCQPDGLNSDPTRGDAFCAEQYRIGSYCIPSTTDNNSTENNAEDSSTADTGTCSNPFVSGCLHSILGEKEEGNNVENTFRIKKRVCNSDDSLDGAIKRGECEASQFDYQEV